MTVSVTPQPGGDLVVGELARRCRCDRPCEIATADGARCLKCGRPPALRLPAGKHLTSEPRRG